MFLFTVKSNLLKAKCKLGIHKLMKPLRRIGRFLSFPHVWTCIIILVIALVSAFISYQLNTLGENYWSSIFANFFAGLITGFVIYLIGCVKQISIIKMQEKKAWLDHLHQMILEYFNSYHKLISLHFDKFDDNEETFDLIYDVGSLANSINEEILQNTFNETLSFNPVKYCKRNFKYDADALRSEYNKTLHLPQLQKGIIICASFCILTQTPPIPFWHNQKMDYWQL